MSHSSDFSHDDVEQILRIIDGMTDVEVRFESGDIKLHVRKFSGKVTAADSHSLSELATTPVPPKGERATVAMAPGVRADATASSVGAAPGELEIRASILGRFYRAASPSEPPYVEVGQRVTVDDAVCIIEVMKLFNTVKAGVNGTIARIAVENGAMVEFDQVLFVVKPD
jgi:acetyl-CoA carboxylase biotin carboxyl carrier protein